MKKIKLLVPLLLLSFSFIHAQHDHAGLSEQELIERKLKSVQLIFDEDSIRGFNEIAARQQAAWSGAPKWEQTMQISYAKRKYINYKYNLVSRNYINTNPTIQSGCTNVDFETGNTSGWTITEGTNTNSSTMAGCCPSASTRFTVIGPGTDPSVPALATVPAGGGNYSLLIGDGATTGGYVVRASQTFTVTAANSVFIYKYAVVLEDAGHTCTDQPYFNIAFTDCSNNPIPCAAYNVVPTGGSCSSGGDPSFQTSGAYKWKNWATRSFDLTPYIGQCVKIEFTASDCAQGGHAGWAYVDCSCQPMTLSLNGTPIPVGQNNSYFCQGVTNNQLCAPPGFTSYSWVGPGVTGQTAQCINPTVTGSYSVTLGMAGSSCNSPVLYSNFTITQKPTANFNYTVVPCAANYSVLVSDNSSTNGGANIQTYTWDWGDGTTFGTNQNDNHTYASAGTKTVELKVSNGGCSDSITKTFNVSVKPTAAFTTTNVCVGTIANFNSTSTPTAGLTQSWTFGDGSANGMGATTAHTYTSGATYNVKLVVTTPSLCKDSITQPITIYPKPTVSFTTSPVCFGTATSFSNTTTISPASALTWAWDYDNNTVVDNTTQSPSYTYTNTGNYTVELKATSANGCSDSTTVIITVNPMPTVTFTPVDACVNNNVVLNNTSSVVAPDNIQTWNWNFGGGTAPSNSTQNPTPLTYATSGVKTITLTATTNHSCSVTVTNTVNINPQPTAAFVASAVCKGIATTFTDQSTPTAGTTSVTAWAWDYTHDGTIDNTTQNPSFTFGSSGTFSTALVVTSANGCKDTVIVPVDVWGHASVNFSPTNVCFGTVTTFSDQTLTNAQANTGNLSSWNWTFGDGGTAASQNPPYTYTTVANATANTNYTVKLVVNTSHGCADSLTKTVTVFSLPTPGFTADSACFNSPTHLVDASNGNGNALTGYIWDYNGDGVADASGVSNPNHVFPAYGNTSVSYTVSTTPAAGLSCKTFTTQNIWVNPLPVPAFSFTNVCINAQPMNYDATASSIPVGTNTLYAWGYGDGVTGTGTTTNHTYGLAGSYNVTLTLTSNKGCVKNLTQQVTVYEKPHVTFSSAKTCFGSPTTFNGSMLPGSGNVTQWLWDFNSSINTIEGNGQNPSFTFNSQGTQTISLISITDPAQGSCRDTITRQIYVNYVPHPQFTVDKPAGCPLPHCVVFTDNTPAIPAPAQVVTWIWRFGDGTSLTANSNSQQSHCYTNSSSSALAYYNVTLVAVSDSSCTDSLTKNNFITVYPKPVADYTVNPNPGNVVEPLEYFINNSHDFTKWWWTFGDGSPTDSTNLNPSHTYSDVSANTYGSTLLVMNQYGCTDTAHVLVEIGPEFVFYIPNCFTPGNNDGINDGFIGKGIGISKYEMWIFDRWGMMIYYTDDINKPWDGRVQGKQNPVQQDVYVWKVKLFDVFGKKHDYVGHVTVLRGN
ncbi:MAG: PKD domain-containing protein [Bacteroidetes bacterium]|nr:PKD domain-containing protein [Bacteroidota bacterium]